MAHRDTINVSRGPTDKSLFASFSSEKEDPSGRHAFGSPIISNVHLKLVFTPKNRRVPAHHWFAGQFSCNWQTAAGKDVSNFLVEQLDFILFFYGFAFLLLGLVCLGFARSMPEKATWLALGLFGLIYGAGKWLDLLAVIIGDGSAFAATRVCAMTVSFACLVEAARIGLKELGWNIPGRWMYGPLLAIVVVGGLEGGLTDANAAARYAIGLPGSIGVALLFFLYAKAASGTERNWTLMASAAFALHGIAVGVIAPATFLGPHSFLNPQGFRFYTGIPIPLIRGILACSITLSIWGIWGQKITGQVLSKQYTRYWRRQFVWTLSSAVAILMCGWLLTQHLGQIYSRNVMQQGGGELSLVASLLAEETISVTNVAEALASSPALVNLLDKARSNSAQAKLTLMLRRYVTAAAGDFGFILGPTGIPIVSSGKENAALAESDAPLFRAAMAGRAGYALSIDNRDGEKYSSASAPVSGENGEKLGVVLIKKSLNRFSAIVGQFDRPVFLVNADGIVMVTNKPDMLGRALWPVPASRQEAVLRRSGNVDFNSVQPEELTDRTWAILDDKRIFVRRYGLEDSGWSLIVLVQPQEIGASRALGIIMTLLAASICLVFLVVRERRVHDRIQSIKRGELERLTRELDRQASTDALTGTSNRAKFNQELARHILDSERTGAPLSLVLYDVDHFKQVNDTYGHLAGDRTLVSIANISRQKIRDTDFHARWGGEEFVILAPGSTNSMACSLAEHLRCAIEDSVFEVVGMLTCSFGVVQFEAGDTPEKMLARADSLLYKAKVNGRNRVEGAGPEKLLLPVPSTVF